MSLPYPYEVETGELKRRPPLPRIPFDVQRHLEEAIRVRGDALEVFGVTLAATSPGAAPALAEELRRGVAERFQERLSAPDDATWASFASQAHEQLAGRTELDPSTLRILRLTIDAL